MTSDNEDLKIYTINYKSIEGLQVISFNELPEERQRLFWEKPGETQGFEIFEQAYKTFENCLMNPKRMEEVEQLTPEEFFDLFWKWIITSTLEDEIGEEEE